MNKQEKMEAVIAQYVKDPPATLYDIGVGPKTEAQTLRSLWPDLEVFGVEPLPDIHGGLDDFPGPLLEATIGFGNETTISWDSPLTASVVDTTPRKFSRTVRTVTLDEFDWANGHPGGILLWMDIEGAELEALRSGPRLLKSGRVSWINTEERRPGHESPGWPTGQEIEEYLRPYGFERFLSYNPHPGHWDVIYKKKGVPCQR